MHFFKANVERWERSVNDDEEELDRAKQAEQKQMSEIDLEMRKLDRMKSDRLAKKSEMDNMDEEIAKVKAHIFRFFNFTLINKFS